MRFAVDLSDPSTHRGIILMLAGIAIIVHPEYAEKIVGAALTLAGGHGFFVTTKPTDDQ